MKQILSFCAALMVLFAFPETAWVIENQKENTEPSRIEKYYYEAVPADHPASHKEFIEMEFIAAGKETAYRSRLISPGSSEEITIRMDKNARFISGTRRFIQSPDRLVQQEKIWTNQHEVVVERTREGVMERKEYRLPKDKELAVDGSLLARLRFFPFDEGKKWNLFMVDFSGYSITVTVSQEGREKIDAPAGEFECYRLIAEVNIPILKPKIFYWLWTQKPNFLVKHQGKRGPFTPSYTTSLVAFE